MTTGVQWVPGVQLEPDGPAIELPAGWSVGASPDWPSSFWAWSADDPNLQLGHLAAAAAHPDDVDGWVERVASDLVDGRIVSIDERSNGSVTVVWHWLNMGVSSLHVQSRLALGSSSGIVCANTPASQLVDLIPLFDEYLVRAAATLGAAQPPTLSELIA